MALNTDANDSWHVGDYDEMINNALEDAAKNAKLVAIPKKLKATIQFGYEDGLKKELGTEDFDAWIETVFAHTQSRFRHSESLGTTIEFEVCKI